MFCRKCGRQIPDDSVFCSYCGETVTFVDEVDDKQENLEIKKEHGFCSECGEPLPDGKIIGLCDNCTNHKKEFYKPYSVMPKGTYHADIEKPDKGSKGCLPAFIASVCVVCVFLFAISMFASSQPSVATSTDASSLSNVISSEMPSVPAPKSNLELLNDSGSNEGNGIIRIKGSVKNNTSKIYSYAQIQYNLYDKSGNQVGTALANINGLEPGKTWKFEAIGYATSEVDTYKLTNLVGY